MIIGCDPGTSGGIAALGPDGDVLLAIGLSNLTERQIVHRLEDLLGQWRNNEMPNITAYLEKVHSSPQMGVRSAFTFGQSYGFLRGVLNALGIPFVDVTPQAWRKSFDLLAPKKGGLDSAGHNDARANRKAQSHAVASLLFKTIKVTHAIADALLLAEHGRRLTK